MKSLLEIAQEHDKSIISLLLATQKRKIQQNKLLSFLESLECLRPQDGHPQFLSRRWINAFEDHNYVALSYTWAGSKHEDSRGGSYKIQSRDRAQFHPSTVRDCILERVLRYMNQIQVSLLWVDKHCIRQQRCRQTECSHRRCVQKQHGLQTMDRVYSLSKHPVALLGQPIRSSDDLALLAKVLSGKLVFRTRRDAKFLFCKDVSRSEAGLAVLLLKEMTSDLWWRRAWIFQESYRAGGALTLLIPHHPSLERQKRSYGIELFGNVNRELLIKAVQFSYEATSLCLAFNNVQCMTREESNAIGHILTTSGRYTILLGKHESMTPVIMSDIEKRDIESHWDRLAIVANCCQYTTRLDIPRLAQERQSISLSTLTMCLLNGEILRNKDTHRSTSQMTASEFLQAQSFKGFYAPTGTRSLSFNKGCRFVHTRLTPEGVFTMGHIWQLGRLIHPREVRKTPSWVEEPVGMLSLQERKRLTQLANRLKNLEHFHLGRQIEVFLQRDSCLPPERSDPETFAAAYMRTMSSELVVAIDSNITLRLGSLWEPSGRRSPYRAIFIRDFERDGKKDKCKSKRLAQADGSSLIFTASRPEFQLSDRHDANDVDRHVSLFVRHKGFVRDKGKVVPRLYVDSWILGLCFFEGLSRTSVIFPWPPGLTKIRPRACY